MTTDIEPIVPDLAAVARRGGRNFKAPARPALAAAAVLGGGPLAYAIWRRRQGDGTAVQAHHRTIICPHRAFSRRVTPRGGTKTIQQAEQHR
jgi:hypothetical protein